LNSKHLLAIEVSGLVKTYGETQAVRGVDLEVPAGTVYGLLGPNGAGKTTTARMLATLTKPTAGTASVFGYDVIEDADQVRSLVSMTGQFASVDEDLTGIENMVMIGRLLGFSWRDARERGQELIDAFGLSEATDRQVKTYSGGMRRRLDIAASIIVTPEVLFLDEPTTGLDPRSRNEVWDIVRALVASGTTVLLTTQYLDEADQLADRIAVIDHGKVIAEGTPAELKASVGAGTLHVRVRDPEERPAAQGILTQALDVSVELGSDPSSLIARVGTTNGVSTAFAELSRRGIEVTEFALGQPSLDEVFLTLTGRPADEQGSEEQNTEAAA
jgi:ABC-2 type transport system ATP-binding protein